MWKQNAHRINIARRLRRSHRFIFKEQLILIADLKDSADSLMRLAHQCSVQIKIIRVEVH